MKKKIISFGLAIAMIFTAVPFTSFGSVPKQTVKTTTADTQTAERTVSALGIMKASSLGSFVTRGHFAQILVNASSYKGNTDWATQTSPFVDVSSSHWASSYIQMAVNNGWMYGYLGGNFKPDEPITLQEAVYGVTSVLGYSGTDFQGNRLLGRMNLYYEKNLSKNISRSVNEQITRKDCVYLFYNMLKTSSKTGVNYGTSVFDCTTDPTTGEINYMALIDNNLVGPILLDKSLSSILPFSVNDATFYVDKVLKTKYDVDEGDVIYYNTSTKTVWAYQSMTNTGVINSSRVEYGNGGLTPTAVTFGSGANAERYILANSAVAYEFSSFGDAVIAEETVTIIFEERTDEMGNVVRYITGVITPN